MSFAKRSALQWGLLSVLSACAGTPPELPRVPPPPVLTPRAINTAIMGVLAKVETRHRAPTLKAFVDMGVGLASR